LPTSFLPRALKMFHPEQVNFILAESVKKGNKNGVPVRSKEILERSVPRQFYKASYLRQVPDAGQILFNTFLT